MSERWEQIRDKLLAEVEPEPDRPEPTVIVSEDSHDRTLMALDRACYRIAVLERERDEARRIAARFSKMLRSKLVCSGCGGYPWSCRCRRTRQDLLGWFDQLGEHVRSGGAGR